MTAILTPPGQVLYAILKADEVVRTLLLDPNGTTLRIFPGLPRQKPKMPTVTYEVISNGHSYATSDPIALVRPRVQVDCWAGTYDAAQVLGDAVKTRLSGFRGLAVCQQADGEQHGVQVGGVFLDLERDQYDDDVQQHRRIQDWLIWYEEV